MFTFRAMLLINMALLVMEFQVQGYKIRKIYASKSLYQKKIGLTGSLSSLQKSSLTIVLIFHVFLIEKLVWITRVIVSDI